MRLAEKDRLPVAVARSVCFIICTAATMLVAEILYRYIDYPSKVSSHMMFDWIRR